MAQDPVYGRMMGAFTNGAARLANDHHRVFGWGAIADWESRAACRDTDISIWFGSDVSVERGERRPYRSKEQTLAAKTICASCPVLDQCREWALRTRFPFGVVGGWTERERQTRIYGTTRSATAVTSTRRASKSHGPLSGRVCVVCSEKFEARRKDQRCCSPACTDFWRWKSARDRRERQRQAG
jgi:WhiB family redox-sensing transcriptional regulator